MNSKKRFINTFSRCWIMARKKKEAVEELVVEDFQELVLEKKNEILPGGSVIFLCPQCGKERIKRTFHERQLGTKYRCNSCKFEGPN